MDKTYLVIAALIAVCFIAWLIMRKDIKAFKLKFNMNQGFCFDCEFGNDEHQEISGK